jgi:hypothetical protein
LQDWNDKVEEGAPAKYKYLEIFLDLLLLVATASAVIADVLKEDPTLHGLQIYSSSMDGCSIPMI